jgi:hypothetical protein
VNSTLTDSTGSKTATATCPAGKTVVGGGASVPVGVSAEVGITQSEPGNIIAGKATQWLARANELNNTGASWTLTVRVICATG